MLRGRCAHCRTLRQWYRARWFADWPYDDRYLRELTQEADTVATVLILMRECHPSLGALTKT